MAVLRVFAVLAVVAAASAATNSNITAQVKEAETLGTALVDLLQKQWSAKTAQQSLNVTAAEKTIKSQYTGESLKGVTAAFAALDKLEEQIIANISSFAQLQVNQTEQIVKNYTTLLDARVASQSTEEQPIHDTRASATAVMNSWVPLLSEIHEYAHQAFGSAVRQLAANLSKSYEHPVNDEVRVAIENAGVQLLEEVIEEQNADTGLLTSTQFNIFQNYFQKAETALIALLVEAKNAKPSSPAAPPAPGTPTVSTTTLAPAAAAPAAAADPSASSTTSTTTEAPAAPADASDAAEPAASSTTSTTTEAPAAPADGSDAAEPAASSTTSTTTEAPAAPADASDADEPAASSTTSTTTEGPAAPADASDAAEPAASSTTSTTAAPASTQ